MCHLSFRNLIRENNRNVGQNVTIALSYREAFGTEAGSELRF